MVLGHFTQRVVQLGTDYKKETNKCEVGLVGKCIIFGFMQNC